MLFALVSLFAKVPAEGAPAPGGAGGGIAQFLLTIGPILLLFYFLMIRPARRQEGERTSMIKALKKNDKVVTAGGLIGVVADVKENEDEISLKVDQNANVRVRVTKASIVRVVPTTGDAGKDQKDG
jgi:preprotein translocase subunit YajC